MPFDDRRPSEPASFGMWLELVLLSLAVTGSIIAGIAMLILRIIG